MDLQKKIEQRNLVANLIEESLADLAVAEDICLNDLACEIYYIQLSNVRASLNSIRKALKKYPKLD